MRKTLAISLLAGAFLVMESGSASAIDQWPDTGWSSTDCFDNSGAVIACDGSEGYPGQDGSHTGPARSYTVNGADTVTDNVAGLMWVRDGDLASGQLDWSDAQTYISGTLNGGAFAGYTDWRLPTVAELATLVDNSEFNPSLDAGGTFLNTPSGPDLMYWSITEYALDPADNAWAVNFTSGFVGVQHIFYSAKTDTHYVRAVRDVQ